MVMALPGKSGVFLHRWVWATFASTLHTPSCLCMQAMLACWTFRRDKLR